MKEIVQDWRQRVDQAFEDSSVRAEDPGTNRSPGTTACDERAEVCEVHVSQLLR